MDTPDLTTYRILHRTMRIDSRRLAVATAAVTSDDRVQQARRLSRWYAGFRHELHLHHEVEDTIFFPRLFERVPTLADRMARVSVDHDELTHLLDHIVIRLEDLGRPQEPWGPARDRAVDSTRQLHRLLEEHLDFEDDDILPLFERHFTAAEYDAMDADAKKGMKLGTAKFTVPWLMEGASPDEQQAMFAVAPKALKVVWWMTRRGYARRATAALGAAEVVALSAPVVDRAA